MKACPVCQREYPDGAMNCTDDGVPLVAMGKDVHARSTDLLGQIVEGRWKIERIIGKGGMGTVYACRHVVVGKIAAMKVLRAGADRSDAVLQRFVREAQTANLLRSRHIVEVSDFGQLANGAFFVVMELLEGQDLAHAMRNGLGRRELVHVFMQVAETLQAAHEKGIVHRDLKPDNVFLVNEGGDPLFVKLLDFGIAKIMHGENTGGLTETGVILGTPYYMSPEQARAEAIDHRTDIYALGVMMYRAFTGRLPFMADSTMGVLTRHITEAPQPPSEIGNVDTATERMILRCLAKKAEYRFQSMRELGEALRQVPLDASAPGQVAVAGALPVPTPGAMQAAWSGAQGPGASGGYSPQNALTPYGHPSQHPSGPHTPAPMAASAPMFTPPGAHAAAASGAFMPAPTGGYTGSSATAMGLGPAAAFPVVAPEPTTSGVAATAVAPARTTNTLLLVVGALSTTAIGAVAALIMFGRPSAPAPAAPPATVVVVAPAPATAAPTGTASAAATTPPTAAVTATAEASAAPAPTVARPRGVRAPPPPTASAAAPAGPKLPHDVRSPFD